MEIRKSTINDLEQILNLYEQARTFMRENGNPGQWGNNYPEVSIVEEDIKEGVSYVCVKDDCIVGTFMYADGPDETYLRIYEGEWINDEPYGVIHRITTSANTRGVATFCLAWCNSQHSNIRIDTHSDNIPMQNFLNKNGFKKCGIINLQNGDERIAFQKVGKAI